MRRIKSIIVFVGIAVISYMIYILSTRDFYYVNKIPITIYKEKLILGYFYWGFLTPKEDYIIFDTYSVGEKIYFYDVTDFVILTSSSKPKMMLQEFQCKDIYYIGNYSISEFENTHKLEDAYIMIDMYWDFGRFRPILYYKTDGDKIRYVSHLGFFNWKRGSL